MYNNIKLLFCVNSIVKYNIIININKSYFLLSLANSPDLRA